MEISIIFKLFVAFLKIKKNRSKFSYLLFKRKHTNFNFLKSEYIMCKITGPLTNQIHGEPHWLTKSYTAYTCNNV